MKPAYLVCLVSILVILSLFASGCISLAAGPLQYFMSEPLKISKMPYNQTIIDECIMTCNNALSENRSLGNGPCLLDPMTDSDWVCDIAHSPRQETDNLAENQCSSYINGDSHHFIELSPECGVITIK